MATSPEQVVMIPTFSSSKPALPSEVYLNIFEQCDIRTPLRVRLTDKAMNEIISNHQIQIAARIAADQVPGYDRHFASQDTKPSGLCLLKCVYRLPIIETLWAEYARRLFLWVTYDAGEPELSEVALSQLSSSFGEACRITWSLSECYRRTEMAMNTKTNVRHPAYHKRLHRDIAKNLLHNIETTEVTKLFHYRLLFVLRSTEPLGVCWSHRGYAIPGTDGSTWIDHRHHGQAKYKTYKDAREWAAWYSFCRCHPSNMLKHLNQPDTSGGFSFSQDKIRMQDLQSIGRMARLYRKTPGHIRALQMRTAEVVLGAVDKKLSKAELLARKIMPDAVRELVKVPTFVCPLAGMMYSKNCYCPGF